MMPWCTTVGTPFSIGGSSPSSGALEPQSRELPVEVDLNEHNASRFDASLDEYNIASPLTTVRSVDTPPSFQYEQDSHDRFRGLDDHELSPQLEAEDGGATGAMDGGVGASWDFSFDHIDMGSDNASEVVAPVDSLISPASMSHVISKTVAEQASLTGLKLPWEQGIFKEIFGTADDSFGCLRVPLENFPSTNTETYVETTHDVVLQEASDLGNPIFWRAISNISDQSFMEQRLAQQRLAVTKWLCIIQMHLLASSTGRLILNLGKGCHGSDEAHEIVSSVIGIRSHTTAIGRANAMLKYLRWITNEVNDIFLAFREESVWSYFGFLKSTGSAATSASSLLSAMRYAKFVMGFETLDGILASNRIKGSADLMYVGKEYLKQAKVLTVKQVTLLHNILLNDAFADFDRAAAGYLLLALYGRCRHSDLRNVTEVIHDFHEEGGFLEVRTASHKTARGALRRTVLLPIILPALGSMDLAMYLTSRRPLAGSV